MAIDERKSRFSSPEFLGAAGGGLAGALKGIFVDQPAYEAAVANRALEARFAPLMGQAAPSFSDIQAPSGLQTSLDYGLTGLSLGRNIRKADEEKARFAKQEKRENRLLSALEKSLGQKSELPPVSGFGLQQPQDPFADVNKINTAEGPVLDFASFQRRY